MANIRTSNNYVASSQVTITDLNDGKTYFTDIKDNKHRGGVFIYKTGLYNPEISADEPLILTPELTSNTSSSSLITNGTSIKWVITSDSGWEGSLTRSVSGNVEGTGNLVGFTVQTDGTLKLEVNKFEKAENFTPASGLITCEVVIGYRDEVFQQVFDFTSKYTMKKLDSGEPSTSIIVDASPDNIFNNVPKDSAKPEDKIQLIAQISAGGKFLTDSDLTNEDGWCLGASTTPIESNKGKLIYDVYPNQVNGSSSFKFKFSIEGVTYYKSMIVYDLTDPFVVNISNPAGNTFKAGAGAKTLTANIWVKEYDNNVLQDTDAKRNSFNYEWLQYDRNGDLIEASYEGVTGKPWSIIVTSADINTQSTYEVKVSKK